MGRPVGDGAGRGGVLRIASCEYRVVSTDFSRYWVLATRYSKQFGAAPVRDPSLVSNDPK